MAGVVKVGVDAGEIIETQPSTYRSGTTFAGEREIMKLIITTIPNPIIKGSEAQITVTAVSARVESQTEMIGQVFISGTPVAMLGEQFRYTFPVDQPAPPSVVKVPNFADATINWNLDYPVPPPPIIQSYAELNLVLDNSTGNIPVHISMVKWEISSSSLSKPLTIEGSQATIYGVQLRGPGAYTVTCSAWFTHSGPFTPETLATTDASFPPSVDWNEINVTYLFQIDYRPNANRNENPFLIKAKGSL